jgi:hypothetical protein
MKEKYYIFLDVDGVLNNERYLKKCFKKNGGKGMHMYYAPFDPKCLNNLMKLYQKVNRKYDAELVLSSTWRLNEIAIEILNARLAEYGMKVNEKTSVFGERQEEIINYLLHKENNNNILVIDDDCEDLWLFDRVLVKTNWKYGFRKKDLRKALRMVRKNG